MLIPIKTFTGEYPRSQAQLLPDNAATNALDCDFTRGNLTGIRGLLPVTGLNVPSGVKSMFVYEGVAQSMFAWTRDVDAVRSPLANDSHNRFYWTDGAGFYVSRGDVGGSGQEPSGTNKYKVGVPTPAAPMTVNVAQTIFSLPNVASSSYSLFCEAEDGTESSATSIGSPVKSATATSMALNWAVGISCPTLHTESAGTTTSSGGDVVADAKGNLIPQTQVNTTVKAAVDTKRSPAMRITFSMVGGGTLVAVLRASGDNEIPSDFVAFNWSITIAAGSVSVSVTAKAEYKEFRAYTYTYVNQYGEESGPAEPATLEVAEGQGVVLGYTVLPAGHGYCPISFLRVYRTVTGSASTSYMLVGEAVVNATTPTFSDTKKGGELGEPLPTGDFAAPPQSLSGLCVMNNGILAAFSGSELYFMEPYLPYAYRPHTVKPLPHRIIGICPTEDGLYVTTTAEPYLITGVSSDTMTDRRIPAIQAGVSKAGICAIGSTVAYASHDGIVLLRGIDASLEMSFQFFTRDVWRERYASKLHLMRLNAHDGNIVVWFEDGTPGFLIRTEEGAASFSKMADGLTAAFVYPVADTLYVANAGAVKEFKAGVRKAFSWTSKDFVLPKPVNFGCIQVVGTGSVTVSLYADGVLRATQAMTLSGADRDVYRMPAGFLCRRWSIKVDGAAGAEVTEIYLAGSPGELQGG